MIRFSMAVESARTPEAICRDVLNVATWSSFKGHGPIPGITRATSTVPEGGVVGTEIQVENTDGSSHRETVVRYVPGGCLVMRIDGFRSPLRHLATHFVERWDFSGAGPGCQVRRTFELHPKSRLTAFPLWIISRFLRAAVRQHTAEVVGGV